MEKHSRANHQAVNRWNSLYHAEDPPELTFYSIRTFLELTNPNSFVEGAIKQKLRDQQREYLDVRKELVAQYCAKHGQSPSEFPEPRSSTGAKYRLTGPDFDNCFLQSYASLYYRVAVGSGLIVAASVLPLSNAWSHWAALIVAVSLIPWFLFLQKRIRSVSDFNENFQQPRISCAYGKIAPLLHLLQEVQKKIAIIDPDFEHSIQYSKSRCHPSPSAFSIELISHVVHTKNASLNGRRQGDYVIHFHILGDSLFNTFLIVWWFEYPKSLFLSRAVMNNIGLIDKTLTIEFLDVRLKLASTVRNKKRTNAFKFN